jgi:hypothetical protein
MRIEVGRKPSEVRTRYLGCKLYKLSVYKAMWIFLRWFYIGLVVQDTTKETERG